MDFSFITDSYFYAVAIPAVLLTGISKAGFGGAVGGLAVPLLSLAVPPTQALAIMLPLLCVMDILGVTAFRRTYDARILRLAIPAGLVGILIGTLLLRVVETRWIQALIGIEAVLFALNFMFRKPPSGPGGSAAVSPAKARFWSAMSGFTSFISHAGSPPMLQFMLPLGLEPKVFVGTMNWFFAVINYAKWIPYAALGLIDLHNAGTSAVLLPLIPIGFLLGYSILRKINAEWFRRIATWGLLLTGLKLCWDAFM
jgi:uncharacterized membrane protein YfcA